MREASRDRGVPLVLALGVALLAGCGQAPTPSVPGPTAASTNLPTTSPGLGPTAPAAPSAAASASLPPSLSGWRPIALPAALAAFRPTDVVWTGHRFVVIGGLDGSMVALDSTDGSTWHTGSPFGKDAMVRAVAAGVGGSVVAVGTSGDRPTIWHSADGVAWTAGVDPVAPRSVGGGTILVTDVVATSSGWLAVGREDPACQVGCGVEPSRALAWTSPDGRRWATVPEQSTLRPGGMNVVTRAPFGYLAGGVADRGPAIWTSSDGLRWSRVGDVPTPSSTDPSTWMTIVAASASPDLAVCVADSLGLGPGGAPVILAWSSTNGRAWQPAVLAGTAPVLREGVVWTADGWLVTGDRWRGELNWILVAWGSVDGRAWRAMSTESQAAKFVPSTVAASATLEVAVGLADIGALAPADALWWRPAR